MTTSPILLLGLDAADADLITTLIAAGELPNLARLRETGRYGRLATPADHYAGAVWPTFYTGMHVPWHGAFHNKLWRPDSMRVEVAAEHWIRSRPFWEGIDPHLRVCIVDAPMVLGAPKRLNGVYLGGWGTHDVMHQGSWPRGLWGDLVRRYGAPAMPAEHFGAQSRASLITLASALEASTRQFQDVVLDVLQRERWDLACVVFGAMHRAGHYLWDASQVEDAPDGAAADRVRSGLGAVYAAVDRALGAILDRTGEETLVLCFAVHGMAANRGWSDLLPDLLAALEHAALGTRPRRGLLHAVKRRVPHHWVRPLLTRLPAAAAGRLVPLWSRGMFDWSRTRFFPMPMDQAGYLRVNLRGREAAGVVDRGADYDAVCTQLERWMLSLRDEATGRALTDRVERAYARADEDATYRHLLPDLVVPWHGPAAAETRSVTSTVIPGFRYRVPRRLPSGRSGNHTDRGWLIARGAGVTPGAFGREHHVVDLAPTVLAHLGLAPDPSVQGRPIDLQGDP